MLKVRAFFNVKVFLGQRFKLISSSTARLFAQWAKTNWGMMQWMQQYFTYMIIFHEQRFKSDWEAKTLRKMGLLMCRNMCPVLFTENISEPQGQVFLHGQQAGFMSTGQPLVILLHVCEAGATRLFGAQGAAHGSLLMAWRGRWGAGGGGGGGRGGGGGDTQRQHNVNFNLSN